jgi:hypothetical protein
LNHILLARGNFTHPYENVTTSVVPLIKHERGWVYPRFHPLNQTLGRMNSSLTSWMTLSHLLLTLNQTHPYPFAKQNLWHRRCRASSPSSLSISCARPTQATPWPPLVPQLPLFQRRSTTGSNGFEAAADCLSSVSALRRPPSFNSAGPQLLLLLPMLQDMPRPPSSLERCCLSPPSSPHRYSGARLSSGPRDLVSPPELHRSAAFADGSHATAPVPCAMTVSGERATLQAWAGQAGWIG